MGGGTAFVYKAVEFVVLLHGTLQDHVSYLYSLLFFFFQAEDGIRDSSVTGVQTCALPISPDFPSIAIEVGPMASSDYVPIIRAGAEGLVVYQETYQRSVYAELHTAGP